MKKIKVSLCDLANDLNGIDNKSIPIGVGYVSAYCKKIHGDSVTLNVFRTFRKFWEDALKQPPDVVGFGSYDWNYNLTLTTINKLKKLNKNCLIIFGGANAEIDPEDNKIFLKKNKNIDFIVYGDGEKPFSNILENYKKLDMCEDWRNKIKSTPIDLRYWTFFLFIGLFHIIEFIAGIKIMDLFAASKVVEAKLSP